MEIEFYVNKIIEILNTLGIKNVVIEIPIGLKHFSFKICRELKRYGFNPVIDLSYTWGICDISINNLMNFELVIHFAHEIPKVLELIGVFKRKILENEYCTLYETKYGKVLVTHVFYKFNQEIVNKINEKLVKIEQPTKILYYKPYEKYAIYFSEKYNVDKYSITGCYLPCRLSNDDVIYVISSGYFHAITPKLVNQNCKVYVIDVHRCTVENVETIFRKYYGLKINALLKARECKNFVICTCRRLGQERWDLVNKACEILTKLGKDYDVCVMDYYDPELINSLPLDVCIVNTSCPRIAFDDLDRFNKPVLNVYELEYLNNLSNYRLEVLLKWI